MVLSSIDKLKDVELIGKNSNIISYANAAVIRIWLRGMSPGILSRFQKGGMKIWSVSEFIFDQLGK